MPDASARHYGYDAGDIDMRENTYWLSRPLSGTVFRGRGELKALVKPAPFFSPGERKSVRRQGVDDAAHPTNVGRQGQGRTPIRSPDGEPDGRTPTNESRISISSTLAPVPVVDLSQRYVHSTGCPQRSDPTSAHSSASTSRGRRRCSLGSNLGPSSRQENKSVSPKRRQPWLTFSISLTPARTSPPARTRAASQ